jgi:lambda family phage portal protein
MFGWLRRLFAPGPRITPRAKFDAAQPDPFNRRHWANADSLSPNAAASAQDRKTIRERARYEVANNSFAAGACNAIANDVVGSGPRLQILLPAPELELEDPALAEVLVARDSATRQIEESYQRWADESGLADSLRLLVRSGCVDGESFALLADNPALRHPVKLQLRPFEADRCTDPSIFGAPERAVEGIDYDSAGNPTRYTILRQHPGDGLAFLFAARDFDRVPAAQVIHWFRADRPGQGRGVSWLTPALHLFAQLRRYTSAVLAAAETAANIAGILESDLPPEPGTEGPVGGEQMEIPRATLLTVPPGWKVNQLKPEQPVTHFGDFREQILVEIARVLDMPFNRITGNSSKYNYSSGRLDHLDYHRTVWLLRDRLRLVALIRVVLAFLDEAALVPGAIPDGLPPVAEWVIDFHWDSFGDIDPGKEAAAAEKLLELNMTDLAEQCAARGRDWQQVLRQRARELALIEKLGLQAAAPTPPPVPTPTPPPDEDEDEDAEDDEDEDDGEDDSAEAETAETEAAAEAEMTGGLGHA